jgi:hypothetical protein
MDVIGRFFNDIFFDLQRNHAQNEYTEYSVSQKSKHFYFKLHFMCENSVKWLMKFLIH